MFKGRPLVLSIIFVVLLAVSLWAYTRLSSPHQKQQIRIAVADVPVFALVHVSEAGNFIDNGQFQVSYQHYPSGRDALNAVIEGKADLATTYDTPVILQLLRGEDLGIISSLHVSQNTTGILVRTDRGIDTPEQLRGKRIGVTRDTNSEFFLHLFLSTQGIDPSQVIQVETEAKNAQEILESRVDAIVLFPPYLQDLLKNPPAGMPLKVFYSDFYREISVLAGKRKYLLENRAAALVVLKGLLKAHDFIESEPEKAFEIEKRQFPKADPAGLRIVWDNTKPTMEISNLLVAEMEYQVRWRKESIHEVARPDFKKVIILEYLAKLRPGVVTWRPNQRGETGP